MGLIKYKTLEPVAHAARAPQVLVLVLYLIAPTYLQVTMAIFLNKLVG